MALTPFGNFTLDWTAKPTKISGQATNFKTWLNQRTEDIKAYINDTLLTQLGATADGASGGDQKRYRLPSPGKEYGMSLGIWHIG